MVSVYTGDELELWTTKRELPAKAKHCWNSDDFLVETGTEMNTPACSGTHPKINKNILMREMTFVLQLQIAVFLLAAISRLSAGWIVVLISCSLPFRFPPEIGQNSSNWCFALFGKSRFGVYKYKPLMRWCDNPPVTLMIYWSFKLKPVAWSFCNNNNNKNYRYSL